VFNSRTRIVEENLHVKFSKNTPNIAGGGPKWLFDIDALTKSMNYKPIVAENQSNGSSGTEAGDNAGKTIVETVPDKDYILLPLWTQEPLFSSSSKDSLGAGYKPSNEEKKDAEDLGNKDSEIPSTKEPRVDQEEKDSVNSTNRVNVVSSTVNTANNEVHVVGRKSSIKLLPDLEDITIFEDLNEDVFGAEADLNNMESTFQVSPILIIRIHKDHPLKQVIRDLQSTPQTRRMSKKLERYGLVSTVKQRTNHKDLQNCLFSFLSQMEPKRGSKWVFKNKLDKKGIVIRNKARLMARGHTQEEDIDYDEVFAPVAKIEAIRIEDPDFLDKVYKVEKKDDEIFISQDKYMNEILKKFGFFDVKTASMPIETHKTLLKDEKGEDIDEHLYRSMIGSLMYLTSSRPDIMFAAKNINEEAQIHAKVDGKKVVMSEALIRRELQFGDEGGIDCLPNKTIFEQLLLMGYEKLTQKLTFIRMSLAALWHL
nr:ribonuclease H-like domain-containing protein [Tanacetum cinerariifolium]